MLACDQRGDRGFKTRPRRSRISAEFDNFKYKTELYNKQKNKVLDQIHQEKFLLIFKNVKRIYYL